MTNLPKLSKRAQTALEILGDGGSFRHGLERNSYTGLEQFQYRLQMRGGGIVKGIGLSAFYELKDQGLLRPYHHTSVSTYYKLARE